MANKPVFGCIRDKLGVVTRALFAQRDFADRSILVDFYHSLEASFELGLGEGGGEVRVPSPAMANQDSVPFNQDTSPNAPGATFDQEAARKADERAAAIRLQKGKEKERSGEAAIYMGTKCVGFKSHHEGRPFLLCLYTDQADVTVYGNWFITFGWRHYNWWSCWCFNDGSVRTD